jgi:NAD(P)-dependent dehydrogenase (short-subunit alcohol dehydrogenase family)
MIRSLLPMLQKSAAPRIINIASVAGVFDVGTGSVYASTKAALIQLTKSLAVEYAPFNICVNAVSPWYTETRRINPILSN